MHESIKISSADSSKSNTSILDLICSAVEAFGIGSMPFCNRNLILICWMLLPYFFAQIRITSSAIKAKILDEMTAKNVRLWATDTMRLTRKLPTQRTAFNLPLFKEDHPDLNYDDEKYVKISEVSGSLAIAV